MTLAAASPRLSFTRAASGSPSRSRRASRARQPHDHRRFQPQPPVAHPARQLRRVAGSASSQRSSSASSTRRSPGEHAGASQLADVERRSAASRSARQIAAVELGQILRRNPAHGSAPATRRTARPTPPRCRGPRHAGPARAAPPAWRTAGNSPAARPSRRSAPCRHPAGTHPAARASGVRRDAGLGQAAAAAPRHSGCAAARAVQRRAHRVQPRALVGGRQHRAVGDVVGVAGERVEGVDMRAQPAADQHRADREILRRRGPCRTRLRHCRSGLAHARPWA